jgi:ribosomal protein S27E
MKDLVCPECGSSISFASASVVASCTLCGADLDLSSAEPVKVELAPAGEVRGD